MDGDLVKIAETVMLVRVTSAIDLLMIAWNVPRGAMMPDGATVKDYLLDRLTDVYGELPRYPAPLPTAPVLPL